METVIDVQHLNKVFNRETALQDVSFTIKKGEIFGFLGPKWLGQNDDY
ncbi:Fluoroquinolones export ATP-binding protein OS=Lysinibacillus sphaericus OX=1421 GN=LYSIN_03141 PE=4 SV=1 [Lysinibacillus sphaericus]